MGGDGTRDLMNQSAPIILASYGLAFCSPIWRIFLAGKCVFDRVVTTVPAARDGHNMAEVLHGTDSTMKPRFAAGQIFVQFQGYTYFV